MINNISTFAKYIDQPILISKLNKQTPKILTIAGVGFIGYDIFKKQKENKSDENSKKDTLKKGIIVAASIASAIIAPKIASFLTKRPQTDSIQKIKERNAKIIDEYIKSNMPHNNTIEILNKAKEKVLSYSEIKLLKENTGSLFKKLIPDPENIKAKDIFSEIGYLSVYGAIPVAGGITGGIIADKITEKEYKKNIKNKISEGIYQYLANIFMCNIGAGLALSILEKLNITSKSMRAIGMTCGIILTGVIGGAKIANLISGKVINSIFPTKENSKERKPEPLDLCLHADDIATVSLLSGLKWIEPMLPALYTISGYKAGIGYRN